MKYIVIAITAILILTSCGHDSEVGVSDRFQIGASSGIRVIKFQGHEYLAYDNDRGGSLCHSETCPCKSSN